MRNYRRVEADIDLDAIRENIKTMKACLPENEKLLAVIKADAYGHGAVEVARTLDDLTDFYAVACMDEAYELRKTGCKKPLLILGFTDPTEYEELFTLDVRPTMYSCKECEMLSELAVQKKTKARIHIKLDTGMRRIGFPCDETGLSDILRIVAMPGIEIEGIFTHYAKADETDKTSANGQLALFRQMIGRLAERGVQIPVKHISNSAGIMEMDNEGFDMARSGIVTYGLYPSDEVDHTNIKLHPAMELVARIVHVKTVPAGCGIGYGWAFVAPHDMRIATVSAGYADGYPRSQTNIGRVIIRNRYARITGKVCMDQFMIDVTDIPDVTVGDPVVLIGRRGDKEITMEEVAAPANSFNYELACNIGRRVPRVYKRNGREVKEVNYLRGTGAEPE